MSLISDFVANHLLGAVENALLTHEPEMQQVIIDEIENFVAVVGTWVQNKLDTAKQPAK